MSKIVLMGPIGVGKTALSKRLAGEDFFDKYVPTTTATYTKRTEHSLSVGEYQLEFLDLEYNLQTINIFLDDADLVLCVFSLADLNSFELLKKNILNNLDLNPSHTLNKPTYLLIGTNADQGINVSQQDINELSSLHHMKYFKVSSKTNFGIEKLFNYLKSIVIDLFKRRLLKLNSFNQKDFVTKDTQLESRQAQAGSECAHLWQPSQPTKLNIRNILDDYAQANNGWSLWSSGHINRHHTWRISQIVNHIDQDKFSDVNEIIKTLDAVVAMKFDGSLSLRIFFIKAQIGLEAVEEDLINETPNSSWCCGLF